MSNKHFATRAIHVGQSPDPATGAVIPPIYLSTTFQQSEPGVHKGFEYSRTKNPTRCAYEECIASLESGHFGFAFASGMAAINTVIDLLDSNAHIIASDDLYGGTFRIFSKVKNRTSNLSFTQVDMAKEDQIIAAIKPNTRMIWIETPSNPMLKLANIEHIAKLAKLHNILCVVDNTFATPYVQRPLELGCDIVIHSSTKYLNGHSDSINGVIVVGDNNTLAEEIRFLQNACGPIASPFDSYLTSRSLKTLALRMQRHCENAQHLADWLQKHPKIEKVYYPV